MKFLNISANDLEGAKNTKTINWKHQLLIILQKLRDFYSYFFAYRTGLSYKFTAFKILVIKTSQ